MKRKTIKLISAIAAIGITSVLLSACASTPSTPQDIVKGYLEAVQKGDSKTALSLISPNVAEKKQLFLTDEALKSSVGIKSINVFDALTPDEDDPTISIVKASYSLNGKTVEAKFEAKKADDKWVVTSNDAYAELALPFSKYVPTFTVDGLTAKHSDSSDGLLTLFPGSYVVGMEKGNKFLSFKKQTFYADGSTSGISNKFGVLDSVNTDINAQVKTFVESCFAAKDKMSKDDACPNWTAIRDDVTSTVWELIKLPKYGATFDGYNFDLKTLEDPEYKVTWEYTDIFRRQSPTPGEKTLTEQYAPEVQISDDSKLTLTFNGGDVEHKVANWSDTRYY